MSIVREQLPIVPVGVAHIFQACLAGLALFMDRNRR